MTWLVPSNHREFNLAQTNLPLGNYQVRIRALGDEVRLISSPLTAPITYRGFAQVNAGFHGTASSRVINQSAGVVGASLSLSISATNGSIFQFETISSAHMITHIVINGIEIPLTPYEQTGTINGTEYRISYTDYLRRAVRVEVFNITEPLTIMAVLDIWQGQSVPKPHDHDGQIVCEPRLP
jgi:hypothetical protein